MFDMREDSFAAALDLRPAVMQFAWARPDQDLKPYFDRAHDAGCKVTYMAGAVTEAVRAAKAGADIIIAQGTEGGGHVGWMASMPLIPMVVDAVTPVPVLAAGGFADGRGLIAALALGAGRNPAWHSFPGNRGVCRFTSTSSKRLWTATATIRNCRKFPISRRAWCGRAP